MVAGSIEERRLAAPASKEKFGAGSEPAYDAITKFASNVFDVPISILSLVLEDEHGFKSGHGLDMYNVERARALCAHVLGTLEPLIVLDARFDQHVPGAPAFDGEEELRFLPGFRSSIRVVTPWVCYASATPARAKALVPTHVRSLKMLPH